MSFFHLHAKLSWMSSQRPNSLSRLPSPGPKRIAIHVTPAAERALQKSHPWLYESAITHQSGEGKPGDLAVIFDKNRHFLAVGLYDPTSHIRVRVLAHHNPAQINRDFFEKQLHNAAKVREELPENTTGYRLVHGGNDHLPGLVIDRYASTLVVKLYSLAWLPHLVDVIEGLKSISQWERIILRFSRQVNKFQALLFQLQDGEVLEGSPITQPILFQENGLWFESDPISGHKTGFYLDQRDNRERLSKLTAGKSVLNVFAYTGGFSIYAAFGGATKVTSLDISKPALKAANRNFTYYQRNFPHKICDHETIVGDAFQVLNQLKNQHRLFDVVIIDPPAFAKDNTQVHSAIAAYKRLTHLGINLLRNSGILVQASCSSQIDPHDFYSTVHNAAEEMKRKLKEIERTAHPIDHPIGFKEGGYLKCLFAITG